MNHPVLTAISAMHAALDEISGVDPIYMSVAEKKTAMVETAKLRARADALELQLLVASAVDVAQDTGARSTAVWLAEQAREAHGTIQIAARVAGTVFWGTSRAPGACDVPQTPWPSADERSHRVRPPQSAPRG